MRQKAGCVAQAEAQDTAERLRDAEADRARMDELYAERQASAASMPQGAALAKKVCLYPALTAWMM